MSTLLTARTSCSGITSPYLRTSRPAAGRSRRPAESSARCSDSADGYPGLPGWGARSTAAVLTRWGHFEQFPAECAGWNVDVRWVGQLCRTFHLERKRAYLFRDLATLRSEERLFDSVDALRWRGPGRAFEEIAHRLEMPALAGRAQRLAARRSEPSD